VKGFESPVFCNEQKEFLNQICKLHYRVILHNNAMISLQREVVSCASPTSFLW